VLGIVLKPSDIYNTNRSFTDLLVQRMPAWFTAQDKTKPRRSDQAA
jgi:hypothetical protein